MKRIAAVIALFAAATLFTVTGVSAQQTRLRAIVPFEFRVGNRTMPQGTYWIASAGSHEVLLKGNRVAIFVVGSPREMSADGREKLIFDKVGDQYFLSEIVTTSLG